MRHRLAVLFPFFLVAYGLCYYASYLLRFDFFIPAHNLAAFWNSIWLVLLVKSTLWVVTGEWRRTFQYASLADVVYLVVGAIGAAGFLFAINPPVFGGAIPRTVIVIDAMLTVLTIGVLRLAVRAYTETIRPSFAKRKKSRTLIYSADRSAVGILRTLQASVSEYRVVGFVDDSRPSPSSMIAGVRVYSLDQGWRRLARRLRASHVLIPGTLPGKAVRDIVRNCAEANLTAHVIPSVNEIVDGRYKLGIRDVTISDLLRREPAQLDMAAIAKYVTNRRVLVTGAAGSIGSELCRQILTLNPSSLVLFDRSEFGIFMMEQELSSRASKASLHFCLGDITDDADVARIMVQCRPQLVFHAAAYKHVPLMEENPQQAIRNNILGTKAIVDAADRFGAERFVLISTDKAVRPSSIMGASKLVAEKYVQAVSQTSPMRLITVRFGNVLNSAGSVVPIFRRQIETGGPVRVTHPKMERYFMTIPEAVQLVLQAGAVGDSGDVLILEMGDPVKIIDLAKDMIFLSGLKYPDDIEITFTGVRPGEKLAEELFYHSEQGVRRVHEKIFCATDAKPRIEEVTMHVARLASAVNASRVEAAATLRDVVSQCVENEELPQQPVKAAA